MAEVSNLRSGLHQKMIGIVVKKNESREPWLFALASLIAGSAVVGTFTVPTAARARSQQMALVSQQALRERQYCVCVVLLLATAFSYAVLSTGAQTRSPDYKAKVSFLLDVANFVDWPTSAFGDRQSPFTVCVIGPNPFGRTLDDNLLGKQIDYRSVEVDYLNSADTLTLNRCQIAFISSAEKQRFAEIIANFRGTSALLVGDGEGFAASGGMIELRSENNHIRFEINRDAASRANLQLSSKLLALAEIVHEGFGKGKD
jgi:YfiR/HmsC-like